MNEYSASKARENFSEIFNKAAYGKERIIITRQGKKLAAIVPIEDLEDIEALEDEEDERDANEILARIDRGEEKLIPWEVVKTELGWE
jgi:prevent-host-death family protein